MEENYTIVMQKAVEDIHKILGFPLYRFRDFSEAVDLLEHADETNRINRKKKLFRMLKDIGISFDLEEDVGYYRNLIQEARKKGAIPGEKELNENLKSALERQFNESVMGSESMSLIGKIQPLFPTATDYMLRLVNRLSENDAWNNDSLRMRILKQMIKYGNFLADANVQGKDYLYAYAAAKEQRTLPPKEAASHRRNAASAEFSNKAADETTQKAWAEMEDLEKALIALKEKNGLYSPDDAHLVSRLQSLLEIGMERKRREAASKTNVENTAFSGSVDVLLSLLEEDVFDVIQSADQQDNKTKPDENPELAYAKELNKNFKEKFKKLGNALKELEKTVQTAEKSLDGERRMQEINTAMGDLEKAKAKILGRIHDRMGYLRSKDQKPYELLSIANELSKGLFRSGGITRKRLYWFAILYGMTYFSFRSPEDVQAERTDIVKNLFSDYYNVFTLQYAMDEYQKNHSAYEWEPSGQGINYKNFIDVIYIYYIHSDFPREEKIARAERMIQSAIKKQKELRKKENCWRPPIQKNTLFMRQRIQGRDGDSSFNREEDILGQSEDSFLQFILDQYDCIQEEKGKSSLQLHEEQNTAYDVYTELRDELAETKGGQADNAPHYPNYGLMFADAAAYEKYRLWDDRMEKILLPLEAMISGNSTLEKESDASLERENKEISKRIPPAFLKTKNNITRTDLVIVLYYWFNKKMERALAKGKARIWNFRQLYEKMQEEMNGRLLEAGYLPFSGRNFLDILLALSSYYYLFE